MKLWYKLYNGVLLILKKERYPAICNKMDERGGHYANWNKPNTEGHKMHDHTLIIYGI